MRSASMWNRLLTVIALVLLAGVPALAEWKSGSFSRTYGDSNFGCEIDAGGGMGNWSTGSYAYVNCSGRVRILGGSNEVLRGSFWSGTSYGTGNVGAQLRWRGYTVYSGSYSGSLGGRFGYSGDIVTSSQVYWVGWVPVTLWTKVGGSFSGRVSLAAVPTAGSAYVSLNGTARGIGGTGVGIPGVAVGSEITLNLLNYDLTGNLNAGIAGINGDLTIDQRPVDIRVGIGVYTIFGNLDRSIARYSYGSTQQVLFRTW